MTCLHGLLPGPFGRAVARVPNLTSLSLCRGANSRLWNFDDQRLESFGGGSSPSPSSSFPLTGKASGLWANVTPGVAEALSHALTAFVIRWAVGLAARLFDWCGGLKGNSLPNESVSPLIYGLCICEVCMFSFTFCGCHADGIDNSPLVSPCVYVFVHPCRCRAERTTYFLVGSNHVFQAGEQ